MKKIGIALGLTMLSGVMLFLSCERAEIGPTGPATDASVPSGAALVLDKSFQNSGAWPALSTMLIGYSESTDSCGTLYLNSNDSLYSWEEIYFNGVNNDTVLVTYTDVALNTTCEAGSGTSAGGGEISAGYVLFNRKSARAGEAAPQLDLSPVAYISTIQFTLTTSSVDGEGVTLYKSVNGGGFVKMGSFLPAATAVGEFYSIAINEANVALKFVSENSDNGFIKMHDLKIWSKGVPDGSVLYVDDYFGGWNLKGYVTPVPGVENDKKGVNYVPLASLSTVKYDTTITYYPSVPVTYTIYDGAVNPDCYNHHGDTTLVYGLTTGYLEMPVNKATYANVDINASVTVSAVPSVSLIEFWIAATGMSGHYLVYKSVDDGEYTLFQDLVVPRYAGIGKYFRFYVNEKNVSFRFTPYHGEDAPATIPKLFGLKIWSDGKP